MVQTIGSAGESVAAGAIFTLPALFLWAADGTGSMPSFLEIFLIALVGGTLGVVFMIPLRKALIVEEHGTLPYPEGTACAEVLLAGEEGGGKSKIVFSGFGIAALYKFVADGLHIFPSSVSYDIKSYKGAGVGLDVLPALAGVGYICGPRIASYMFTGGCISWLVLMPLMSLFGGDTVMFPELLQNLDKEARVAINQMAPSTIWSSYIRYIGAGAVATGGIISLIKSAPLIGKTFAQAMKSMRSSSSSKEGPVLRTDQDLSMKVILVIVIVFALLIWLLPTFPVNALGAVMVVVFGFFFATVSSRMVGLIGSSNNPVSGMAIATLLFSTIILKATGVVGEKGMVGAIAIGSIICIVAAIAGDTSQDLKTGFIVGATPRKQQIGELIGVVASALTIGGVLYLLNTAWGFGSTEIPAPQANMMKMIVEGVMEGNLPWNLIFVGVAIAVIIEILRIPVLPVAVGMYLPFSLNAGIMAGGLVRLFIDKKRGLNEENRKDAVERGILYTSGMIAGEGIIGILLAIVAVIPITSKKSLADILNLGPAIGGALGSATTVVLQISALVIFAGLLYSLVRISLKAKAVKK